MKSYIYKIYDNTNGNQYYGSTTQKLSMRMCGHRANYKRFMEKGYGIYGTGYCRSFDILKNGDYSYSLVEEVECDSKLILHQRERYYIENNDCINKYIPSRTSQEYYQDNKEKFSEYREANKNKIKEYREVNKEKMKEYHQANKDKIKEYKKEKIECECGCIIRKDSMYRHRKSKKHLDNLKSINPQ